MRFYDEVGMNQYAVGYDKYRREAICKQCGRPFEYNTRKGGRRKYCSPECVKASGRARYIPIKRVEQLCDRCDKPFSALSFARFCSVNCRTRWHAAAFKIGDEVQRQQRDKRRQGKVSKKKSPQGAL